MRYYITPSTEVQKMEIENVLQTTSTQSGGGAHQETGRAPGRDYRPW